jgi:hypothetical protein
MWLPKRRRMILDLPAHFFHVVPRTPRRVVVRAWLRVVRVPLSNPMFLEDTPALRARTGSSGGSAWVDPTLSRAALQNKGIGRRGGGGRRWWSDSLLANIRRMLPGWKSQLIARTEL